MVDTHPVTLVSTILNVNWAFQSKTEMPLSKTVDPTEWVHSILLYMCIQRKKEEKARRRNITNTFWV